MSDDDVRYKVVRTFFNSGAKRTVKRNLPLSLAQEHCRSPEASSQTAKREVARRRTTKCGPWFDGYSVQG